MALSKQKAIEIRDNAERLLKKMEADEQNEIKKLALGYQNNSSTLNKILGRVEKDDSPQLISAISDLKSSLLKVVQPTKTDNKDVVEAIKSLSVLMASRKELDNSDVVKSITNLERILSKKKESVDRTDELIKAIKAIKVSVPEIDFPDRISIDNFPPTKIPQPVTNININPLRGFIETTTTTVDTNLTVLPEYGVLDNRRALIVFNNDPSTTLFVGGSDVTAANGLPVVAQSFSPIIDAGERMILYGITSSGSVDVRVMELSNDAIGG